MSSDDKELNEILETEGDMGSDGFQAPYYEDVVDANDEDYIVSVKYEQWASDDSKIFFPAAKTSKDLPAGVYEVNRSQAGLFFERIPVKTEGLIRFPQSNSDKVIGEIKKFWDKNSKTQKNIKFKLGKCYVAGNTGFAEWQCKNEQKNKKWQKVHMVGVMILKMRNNKIYKLNEYWNTK